MRHVSRRAFVQMSVSLLAAPLVADAQQARRVYRIGILTLGPAGPRPTPWWGPFLEELRKLNYDEGRNLVVIYAGADARLERLSGLAVDPDCVHCRPRPCRAACRDEPSEAGGQCHRADDACARLVPEVRGAAP